MWANCSLVATMPGQCPSPWLSGFSSWPLPIEFAFLLAWNILEGFGLIADITWCTYYHDYPRGRARLCPFPVSDAVSYLAPWRDDIVMILAMLLILPPAFDCLWRACERAHRRAVLERSRPVDYHADSLTSPSASMTTTRGPHNYYRERHLIFSHVDGHY